MTFNVGNDCDAAESCFLGDPPGDLTCITFGIIVILVPALVLIIIIVLVVIFTVPKVRNKLMPYRNRERFIAPGMRTKRSASEYRNETMQSL